MKVIRFIHNKNIHWGIINGDCVTVLKQAPFKGVKPTCHEIALDEIKLLPPVNPTKIILTGLNYKDHAKELNMALPKEPIIFLKPNTTLIGHNYGIIYPKRVRRLDYEAELAVVIKKEGRNIKEPQAHKYIFGYTCLNDITARDLQKKDVQWTRSKSFDTFCPLGPWIETELNPQNLKIQLFLNKELKQDSSTAQLIFSVKYLISFISGIMTLSPGDVISTGTPYGVGPMRKGDIVEVAITGIGLLRNYVK